MMKLLVKFGANPRHRNDQGHSGVAYAKYWLTRQHRERATFSQILTFLREHGCDLSEKALGE